MKTDFFKAGIACVFLFEAMVSCGGPKNPPPPGGASGAYKEHLIDKEKMAILSKEYEAGNYAIINKSREPQTPDSRYVTYDLDVLDGYVQYLKEKAKKNGIKNPKIKIVFGQYPKDKVIDPRQNEKYKGYQMVYLAPADENKSGDSATMKHGPTEDGPGEGMDFGSIQPPY